LSVCLSVCLTAQATLRRAAGVGSRQQCGVDLGLVENFDGVVLEVVAVLSEYDSGERADADSSEQSEVIERRTRRLQIGGQRTTTAALTGKHDTLVRRAPGWQGAPDGQQAKN